MGAFFILTGTLSVLGHALLFRWAQRTIPWVRRHPRWFAALLTILALGAPLSRFFARSLHSASFANLSNALMLETLTVLVAALLTLLFGGTLALGAAAVQVVRKAPETPEAVGRRVALERGVGLAAYAAVGTTLGYGSVRGRHDYTVEELVVRVPGLSPKLEGYTIAQVSDLHAGVLIDEAEFDRGFAFVKALKPDLVVATGDLVDHDAGYAPMIARKLAELGARDGTVAILGNHDYFAGAQAVELAMRRAGVRMLVNQALHLHAGEGPGLAMLGLDDFAGYRYGDRGPDLAAALRALPPEAKDAPRIVLAHQPPFFDDLEGQAFLQLSGHTHGGQINIAGIPSARLVGMHYIGGKYAGPQSSTLWVNRGFGVAGPPARVGAPPEITKIILIAG